ncbi:MAG TPA: tyrosine-type recombinase/integrase, partial [Aggregatilineales bacterium]|nr:tyrosine-type recombinase/integrase [Aggregatilineales bacterium]
MSPKKRADKSQQLPMSFDSTEATSANGTGEDTPSEPEAPAASKGPAKRQPALFAGLLDDSADDADGVDSDDTLEESTALVPVEGTPLGFLETETVNALVAMAGLSAHTQRAYRRWIGSYLADINKIDRRTIDLKALNVQLAVNSLGAGNLKAWLGHLKARKLGKQSIMQAKAAVVWLAQLMGDVGRSDYSVASGLSRVKAPRAETGQREGTWLTQDEVRQLIRALRKLDASGGAGVARNTAIIVLMVTCGLRRDEIATATWGDLGRQGGNLILRVHGKGEKLRTVKLPDMVLQAIERWKPHHPNPAPDRPIFT